MTSKTEYMYWLLIKKDAYIYYGRLAVNSNLNVALRSQHEYNYSSGSGKTTLNGTLTISNGNVSIENIALYQRYLQYLI